MTRRDSAGRSARYKYFVALCAVLYSWVGCNGETMDHGSGETHFLAVCTNDDSCGDALECVCSVCTVPCERAQACAEAYPAATCGPTTCGGVSACDVTCNGDTDCGHLGSRYTCEGGLCRTRRAAVEAGGTTATDGGHAPEAASLEGGTGGFGEDGGPASNPAEACRIVNEHCEPAQAGALCCDIVGKRYLANEACVQGRRGVPGGELVGCALSAQPLCLEDAIYDCVQNDSGAFLIGGWVWGTPAEWRCTHELTMEVTSAPSCME